ncbi:filamentous hemagglutinin N-terminal domain-containing protein [Salmonella enterica]|nr:filamentous hemagglutinin N-terminal domain-containing protein [Salmonella enterica]
MNKIYKLKFDKRRNELVIVSEITAGAGKEKSTGHIADLAALSPFRKLLGTLTPVALLTGLIAGLLPAMVLAADLPTGGQIVGGQGSISTSGNQMTIHQQTQNMATNWHSFDIGKNNTVQFVQPDSSSVALNRVTGASGSQIMGTLKANGQVFILNPNGVLFGKDARVDVGGLVASTKNLSTADFMNGQYSLSGSGNPGAQVVNQGSLTTSKGGYIVLAGERVSNSGTVTTPSGKAVLAAGKTVTLQLDNGGLTSVSVNGSVVNALVENRGLISATNGQVYLTAKGQDMLLNTVVNNSGIVEAKGLASRGGEIVLNGGDSGVVSQSGHLLADSQTGLGGKITLEGQNIHLAGGSLTSATGKTGGGEVYVGGGWQGQDSHIKNASKVVMDKTATVDVSATDAGNGGTAVLWSDDYTNFRGTVLAKGGAQSGNGGRVETSSHHNLQAYGTVDASSPSGKGGEWLLDPTDVTIVGTGTDSNIDSTTNAGIFTPTASGAQILNSSIVSQLNAGTNVTVKTSGADVTGQTGNITVNADIIKTAGADAKLTLLADNNITTNTGISIGASDGKLNLDLLAGNTSNTASVVLGNNINISLNGGDFLAGAANPDSAVSLTYRNNGRIYGGNVTLNVTGGLSGYAYKVQADNDLTINGPVSGSTGWGTPLSFIAGGKLEINSPTSISLAATDTANGGGKVVISGDKGVSLITTDGDILLNAASAATNSVNVSSGNGTVSMSAGGNITLVCATVTSGAAQDIRLDAAGKNSARVNITGSTINSNGGNISIDHAAEGQAMTILISGSTLNTSATNDASHKGNITLSAYNPNVDLTVSSLNGTVTGGKVDGTATSGNAVQITDGGALTNAVATGNASTGTGLNVSGNATLTNATVSGETQTGTGAVVSGKLTADDTTQLTGKATQDSGTGVTLNGTVTGGKVDGVSGQGTGLQLADNAVVTDATLKGTSTSGSGVAVTGNISLDDTTAATLNANSGSGAGLSLEDSANVSIVSITTVTQEKKGPDGNTVTDATGNPVMETITMTTPVTTPVTLTGISQSGSGVATSGNVSISGVILNGSSTSAGGSGATLGGNLTIADDISGIIVNATGNGTGLVVNNVTVNADGYTSTGKNFVINASTSDIGGTAIRTQGNNQLAGVTLNGSAGNGGTAVVLGGQVSGASVNGTSDSGTAVRVSDAGLRNTVVTGNATGNGTGVALSGVVSLDKTTAEALNAVSSGGTGLSLEQSANVSVAGLDAVSTAELKGLSQSGSGITTAGNVAIRGIVLNGSASTDSGVGVTLGGNLTIGDDVSRVTAGATGSGTALVIDNATLQANGYAGTNKGPVILADASGAGGTAVKIQGDNQLNDVAIVGNATSDGGTGVLLDGQVTGANILGTAGSGTGVVVTDGTLMDGGTVKGRSHNGTGLAADGNVTLNHALISGDAQGDSGTGVSLNGSITGGTVNGTSTSGDAVRIKDALFTGTEVNGVAQSGTGVKTQGNVTLKSTELSATSENGITDLDVSGALNRDQYSVINAARIEGRENIHEPQPDTPPSPGEGGATGSGGNTTPDTGDSGGVAGSDTGSGESGETVTPPPGGNGGDAGNNGNTGSATGGEGSLPENNVALRGEVPGAAIREQMTGQMFASVLRQQAVNAQVTRMNQAAQDGFHSAATPVVPVTGYQAKPQNVEISLCDEDSCQPESLNTARPARGVVTSSASGK